MVSEQDLAVTMDRAQRRPQVMRHGVAEALQLIVRARKISGAPPDPVLQLGRAAHQRGGLAGHRFVGPPAVADVPPGSHNPVAELGDPDVECLGHSPPAVHVLVVGVLPGERLAGLGHLDVLGQQAGGHRPGEQLRDGVPNRVLPGPLVHAAPRVVDVLIAEVRDGTRTVVDRREDSEPVLQHLHRRRNRSSLARSASSVRTRSETSANAVMAYWITPSGPATGVPQIWIGSTVPSGWRISASS